MDITYFRLIDFKPHNLENITICAEYLAVTHNKSYISLYDSTNFIHIITHKLNDYTITTTLFFNSQILVIGTNCGVIIVFDIESFDFKTIKLESSILSIYSNNVDSFTVFDIENNVFYLKISNKNEIKKSYKVKEKSIEIDMNDDQEIEDLDLQVCWKSSISYKNFEIENQEVVYKSKDKINAFLECKDRIILIDEHGILKMFMLNDERRNWKLYKEFYVKKYEFTCINNIIDDNYFVVTTREGYIILLDIEKEIIVDEVKARESEILSLCVNRNKLFFSGEDSRLSCYKILNDKMLKDNQIDAHFDSVFKLIFERDRIISLCQDKTIGIFSVLEKGFGFRRVIINNNLAKNSENYVLVNNFNGLDLYELDITKQSDLEIKTENQKIQEERTPDSTNENSYYEKRKYIDFFQKMKTHHLTSFENKDGILAFDISKDGKYIAFTDSKNTFLYYKDKNDFVKTMKIEPSYQIGFSNFFMVILTFEKLLMFYDLNKNECVLEINIDRFDEKIIFTNEFVIIKNERKLIDKNLKIENFLYHTSKSIEFICYDENEKKFYVLEKDDIAKDLNTKYCLYQFKNLKDSKKVFLCEFRQVLRFDGMFLTKNKIIVYDFENIHGFDFGNKKVFKRHLGGVIVGNNYLIDDKNNMEIIVSQLSFEDNYKKSDKKEINVIKWRNKLINKI